MSLWWIPAGIAAWFLIAIVVGLALGRCSQAREAASQQWMRAPDARSQPGLTGRSRRAGARASLLQGANRMLLCEIRRGYRGGSRGEEM
jgi:hypothetical protein